MNNPVRNIRCDKAAGTLTIIDQTLLPGEEREIRLETAQDVYDAIKLLRVRGAPAIGICAAYGLYVTALDLPEEEEAFWKGLNELAAYLNSSRPTAVNLSWAIRSMMDTAQAHRAEGRAAVLEALYERAVAIQEEDIAMCTAISRYGASLLKDGDGVLTHCNAGPLATSRYGTAQGALLMAAEEGKNIHVFADETRPLLQGARLTSYELQKGGVDVTLICDNMASIVMKNGWVQACFVGCDRVAANGDTANKIGTSGVAILARHYGIPFYVLGPTSTIDMDCLDGEHIPIELRSGDEIRSLWYEKPMAPEGVKCYELRSGDEIRSLWYEKPMAPEGVKCYNPAFDVTDHDLITAIITEKGICRPPFNQSLAALFEKE